ncbi:TetR/AcrR family transcriptional regulator [Microbacterium sp. NPDC090007]|uniref:TetR/AcrR family transcriptional regulator n=1 Tax=Microbacterium sp. NPDC090007 TaxID=3364204 RepID=UPI003801941E
MGRDSSKPRILAAAVGLVETQGVAGITLEAVARAAGVTKGGLQYHFASKEDLLDAILEQSWRQAEVAAEDALGKTWAEATPDERLSAFIRSSAAAEVTKADLVLALEGASTNAAAQRKDEFYRRWTGEGERVLSVSQRVALLAADGLALQDALDGRIDARERGELVAAMLEMISR